MLQINYHSSLLDVALIDSLKLSKAELRNKLMSLKKELLIKRIASNATIEKLQSWITEAESEKNALNKTIKKLSPQYKVNAEFIHSKRRLL